MNFSLKVTGTAADLVDVSENIMGRVTDERRETKTFG